MAKTVGIIVTDPTDWTATAFKKSLEQKNIKTRFIQLKHTASNIHQITHNNTNLFNLDGLLVRDVGSSGLESIAFRFDLLLELEQSGIPIINSPGAIQLAANKHLSYWKLKRAGLPLPMTLVSSNPGECECFVKQQGCVVAKPIFGYKGKDVELIEPHTTQRLEKIIRQRGVAYLQEFVHTNGRDIRVFVVGESVPGAIYRVAPEGSWINNLSQGGTPQPCALTGGQKSIAIQAKNSIGAVYAGVDLIEDKAGNTYVLEVNGTPSGYGLYSANKINVTEFIIDELIKQF